MRVADSAENLDQRLALCSDGLLTVQEAAAFLRISRAAIYTMMQSGTLVFVKLGRCRRIPRRVLVEVAAAGLRGGQT